MKILKILADRRVATAVVSAVSAIVCAICTGCKFGFGEFSVKNFSAEIHYYGDTNVVERL